LENLSLAGDIRQVIWKKSEKWKRTKGKTHRERYKEMGNKGFLIITVQVCKEGRKIKAVCVCEEGWGIHTRFWGVGRG
jgi:hypothetical protein